MPYVGLTDPSGGSADSMTLAIAHREDDRVIIDAIRERRPPFSPTDVVIEFASTLRSYGVSTIQSDRYGGIWPVEAFASQGIRCEQSAKPKSDLYIEMLPLLNSGRLALLDDCKLVSQVCGLERRTARSGRDSVDHGPGGHDDVINSIAGAAALALGHQSVVVSAELLQRALAMPSRRPLHAGQHGGRFFIPREQQCYPRGVLPAEKFPNVKEGEST
jgi:hypothetical protein